VARDVGGLSSIRDHRYLATSQTTRDMMQHIQSDEASPQDVVSEFALPEAGSGIADILPGRLQLNEERQYVNIYHKGG